MNPQSRPTLSKTTKRKKTFGLEQSNKGPLSTPGVLSWFSEVPRARRAHPRARASAASPGQRTSRASLIARRGGTAAGRDGTGTRDALADVPVVSSRRLRGNASADGDPRSKRARARCRPRRAPRWRTTRRTSRPRRNPNTPRPSRPRRRRSTSALATRRRYRPRASLPPRVFRSIVLSGPRPERRR